MKDIKSIAERAHKEPVRADLPALAERILQKRHGVDVIPTTEEFYHRFEDPDHRFTADVLINDATPKPSFDNTLTTYTPPTIPTIPYTGDPYTPELNTLISEGVISWKDVEETTLSQSDVAEYVASKSGSEDVIVVVIVDGLSYYDWIRAGYRADPVYVDCPTITDCGYPNVVYGGKTGESLANRLYNRGYRNRLAFSYWEKSDSELTDDLHGSFSKNDVVGDIEDFDDIIAYLNRKEWNTQKKTFIQVTVTGPERVAHKIKENPDTVHQAQLVQNKLTALNDVLSEQVSSHRIFATADHGILWRMDVGDDFETLIQNGWHHTKRRHIEDPDVEIPENAGTTETCAGSKYHRLEYPYLFYDLKSNEPGVHGGYSFQESVVPLIEIQ